MNSAPAWITYITAAIAAAALVISVATYLRAGPRIRVRVGFSDWRNTENTDLIVTIINNGLASVDVISTAIACYGFPALFYYAELSDSVYRSDNKMFRLEPGSQRNCRYKMSEIAEKIGAEIDAILDVGIRKWFVSRLPSGRPRMKFRLFALMLLPFTLTPYLLACMIVSVDLGNGISKSSRPNYLLSVRILSYCYKIGKSRQENTESASSSELNES